MNRTRSTRNHYHDPPTFVQTSVRFLAYAYTEAVRKWRAITPPKRSSDGGSEWNVRRILSVSNVLTLLWVVAIYWGERSVFRRSIDSCDWRFWESWPANANPHHLVFIADPQLVDPHTYPGRPWPLSSLTVSYTDLYLKRVYSLLQQNLYPDTTVFLGDLFDGGREWSYHGTQSPEARYRKYGENFWIREYLRFSKIFVKSWADVGVTPRLGEDNRRRLIISLPGNHDLGFSAGIQKPIRDRFYAYFGEGNRVDIIGNHTFVSLDTVSLSAKDHEDGRLQEIWGPPSQFLDAIQSEMKKALDRELNLRNGSSTHELLAHSLVETEDLAEATLPKIRVGDVADLPTILLTHVPLYRDSGTPCGPLREQWPQSVGDDGKPLAIDERNAIRVAGGYQYQNVLSLDVTKEITSKIGNLKYAFSGDDHDYCEVVHRGYPSNGGITEITVKSPSWAMGVRRPGFVMVSMWNPIDDHGNSIVQGAEGQTTMQTHLCLLPDQLAIFMRYAKLLVLTMSLLVLRAGYLGLNPAKSDFAGPESPLLPTTRSPSSAEAEKLDSNRSSSSEEGSLKSWQSVTSDRRGGLSARSHNARTRSVSPKKQGGYGLPPPAYPQEPLTTRTTYYGSKQEQQELVVDTTVRSKSRRLKGLGLFYAELRWSVIKVAAFVLAWYFWLLARG